MPGTMCREIAAFVSPAVPLKRERRTRVNVLACHAGPARVASVACAAIALAHTLTTSAPLHAAPELSNGAVKTLEITSVSKGVTEKESIAQARARSTRNTRTSGEASRLFSRATRLAAGGDLNGAEELLQKLIEEAPTFAPAYSNIGNLLVARGAYDEADVQYTRSLELAPNASDSWLVHVNRGSVRLARGDTRAALEDMNTADKLVPGQPAVLANRGRVWEALGKYENAIHDYQDALKGNEIQPFWLRYGLVLFERGKSYEAISILNRVAARIGGDDVAAAQAAVYFDRGELGLAESSWSKVDRPKLYERAQFLEKDRKWPPKAVEAMQRFRGQ